MAPNPSNQVPVNTFYDSEDEVLLTTAWPLIDIDDEDLLPPETLAELFPNISAGNIYEEFEIVSRSTIPGLETVADLFNPPQVINLERDTELDLPHFNMVHPGLPTFNPPPIMTAIWLTDSELEATYRSNISPSTSIVHLSDSVTAAYSAASPTEPSSPITISERNYTPQSLYSPVSSGSSVITISTPPPPSPVNSISSSHSSLNEYSESNASTIEELNRMPSLFRDVIMTPDINDYRDRRNIYNPPTPVSRMDPRLHRGSPYERTQGSSSFAAPHHHHQPPIRPQPLYAVPQPLSSELPYTYSGEAGEEIPPPIHNQRDIYVPPQPYTTYPQHTLFQPLNGRGEGTQTSHQRCLDWLFGVMEERDYWRSQYERLVASNQLSRN